MHEPPWVEMAETHRREAHEAILNATAALVAEHGLHAVTMSQVATTAGISQARLCRHFSDVGDVMRAWHDRQIASHLAYLDDIRNQPGPVVQRLGAVLRAYAAIVHQTHEHHTTELGASLHRDERLAHARRHLHGMIRNLLAEGAETGETRNDATPDELADFCLHALAPAGAHSSVTEVRQLVTATLVRLQHSQPSPDHSNL